MKSYLALAFLGFASLTKARPIPHVASGEAQFWENPGYEGDSIIVKAGHSYNAERHFNDKISSIILGEDVRVKVCKDPNCKHEAGFGSSIAEGPLMSPQASGMNDSISFIEVWKKDPKKPAVSIFRHQGCYFGNADLLYEGFYNKDDIKKTHVGVGRMSAIHVPQDMTATLYSRSNFSGKTVTITGPATFCQGLPGKFPDDSMTSMKVYHHAAPKIVTNGQWIVAENKVGAGDLTVSLTKGYTVEHGKTLSNEDTISITTSVEESLLFETASVSTSVSHTSGESVETILQ